LIDSETAEEELVLVIAKGRNILKKLVVFHVKISKVE